MSDMVRHVTMVHSGRDGRSRAGEEQKLSKFNLFYYGNTLLVCHCTADILVAVMANIRILAIMAKAAMIIIITQEICLKNSLNLRNGILHF